MRCRALFRVLLGTVPAFLSAAEKEPVLADKTLVAWVALADTTQQAGAALTVINRAEQFDAIVFAEKATARWMAGSDFFKRTNPDQSSWAREDATPGTLVQVAITYKGHQVTIYRNAKRYAQYPIETPQRFDRSAMVLVGMRYLGDMGEIGPLKGSVEDARLYDVALTSGQIAELVPNRLTGPKPVAWWNFEDGHARDAMETYVAQKLVGRARVAEGKLVLEGGYLWAARDGKLLTLEDVPEEDHFDRSVQTLFYKARSRRTGNMWDVWLFHHDNTYYLYYLAKCGRKWDNIAMARSPDGAHWTEIGTVLRKGPGVTWMGTGSTWKSPNFAKDGTFQMNFSEWKGPRQNIFFAESTDLVTWKRLEGKEYHFVQDERWYQANGRWDCIWTLPRPGGGLYGYWTGTPKPETGGRFGFGETLDGVHWKALPPPKVDFGEGEVGAIEKIGSRYYMMFGHYPKMHTLVAESPKGPFSKAARNFALLTGHTYFSRFFRSPSGLLIGHHAIARNKQVSFAPLKAAVVDKEGTLRLGWWKGNEKMKHEPISVAAPATGAGPIALLGNPFNANAGFILEGNLILPDVQAPRCGLYIECGKDHGSALLLDAAGLAELGPMKIDGTGFKPEKKVNRELRFGRPATFRLLVKGSLLEFYLDDILIECFALPAVATGRIGLIPGNSKAAISDLKAWR